MAKKLRLAIDGNEANISQRVGSNVYAFEIISALEKLTQNSEVEATILLHQEPQDHLPKERAGWKYEVVKPSFFWTQFAAPLYLFLNQHQFDVFYTPGHYAPRHCAVPYVSSVMDLAYLYFNDQFEAKDLIQLTHWTNYSVKNAQKVVTISQASKQDVVKHYDRKGVDVIVAPPGVKHIVSAKKAEVEKFFKKHHLGNRYFLFVGTLQPRKNLTKLINAHEQLCHQLIESGENKDKLPQLVLAGRVGWLAEPILSAIKKSDFNQLIIAPGFVPEEIKPALYRKSIAAVLVGLHEGFGMPALEAMYFGSIPIVADATSLPEVVGEAGLLVDPHGVDNITQALKKALTLDTSSAKKLKLKAEKQLEKFDWKKSAELILKTLQKVAQNAD